MNKLKFFFLITSLFYSFSLWACLEEVDVKLNYLNEYILDLANQRGIKDKCHIIFKSGDKKVALLERSNDVIKVISEEKIEFSNFNNPNASLVFEVGHLKISGELSIHELIISTDRISTDSRKRVDIRATRLQASKGVLIKSEDVQFREVGKFETDKLTIKSTNRMMVLNSNILANKLTIMGNIISLSGNKGSLIGRDFFKIQYDKQLAIDSLVQSSREINFVAGKDGAEYHGKENARLYTPGIFSHTAERIIKDKSVTFAEIFFHLQAKRIENSGQTVWTGWSHIQVEHCDWYRGRFFVNKGLNVTGGDHFTTDLSVYLQSAVEESDFLQKKDIEILNWNKEKRAKLVDCPKFVQEFYKKQRSVHIHGEKSLTFKGFVDSSYSVSLSSQGRVYQEGTIKHRAVKGQPISISGSDVSLSGEISTESDISLSSNTHPYLSAVFLSGNIQAKGIDLSSFKHVRANVQSLEADSVKIDGLEPVVAGKIDVKRLFTIIAEGDLRTKGNHGAKEYAVATGGDYINEARTCGEVLSLNIYGDLVNRESLSFERAKGHVGGSYINYGKSQFEQVLVTIDKDFLGERGKLIVKGSPDNESVFNVGDGFYAGLFQDLENTRIFANYYKALPTGTYNFKNVFIKTKEDILLNGRQIIDGILELSGKRVYFDKGTYSTSIGGDYLGAKMPHKGSSNINGIFINADQVKFDGINYTNRLEITGAKEITVDGHVKSGDQTVLESDIININGALSSLGQMFIYAGKNRLEDGSLISVATPNSGLNVAGTLEFQQNGAIYATNIKVDKDALVDAKKDLNIAVDNNFFALGQVNVGDNLSLQIKDPKERGFLDHINVGAWTVLEGEYDSSDVAEIFNKRILTDGIQIKTTEEIVLSKDVYNSSQLALDCLSYIQNGEVSLWGKSVQLQSVNNIILDNATEIKAFGGEAALESLQGGVFFDANSSIGARDTVTIKAKKDIIQEGRYDGHRACSSSIKSSHGDVVIDTKGQYRNTGSDVSAEKGTILIRAKDGIVIVPISWMETSVSTKRNFFRKKTTVTNYEVQKRAKLLGKSVILEGDGELENIDIEGKKELKGNLQEKETALYHHSETYRELTSAGKYTIGGVKAGLTAALSTAMGPAGAVLASALSSMVTDFAVSRTLKQHFRLDKALGDAAINATISTLSAGMADGLVQGFELAGNAAKYAHSISTSMLTDIGYGIKNGKLNGLDLVKNAGYASLFESIESGINGSNPDLKKQMSFYKREFGLLVATTARDMTNQLIEDGKVSSSRLRDAVFTQVGHDIGTEVGESVARHAKKLVSALHDYMNEKEPVAKEEKAEKLKEYLEEAIKEGGENSIESKTKALNKEEPENVVDDLRVVNPDETKELVNREEFVDPIMGNKDEFSKELTGDIVLYDEGVAVPDSNKSKENYSGMELAEEVGARALENLKEDAPHLAESLGEGFAYRVLLKTAGASIPGLNVLLCFDGDTEICVDESNFCKISEIEAGDLVLAHQLDRLEPVKCPVSCSPIVSQKEIFEVHVAPEDDKNNIEIIRTTDEHQFYTADQGWKLARDLSLKDRLVGLKGIYYRVIDSFETGEVSDVYDITVDRIHNFSVGRFGVIVHNCGADIYRAGDAIHSYVQNELKNDAELLSKIKDGQPLTTTEVDRVARIVTNTAERAALSFAGRKIQSAKRSVNNKMGVADKAKGSAAGKAEMFGKNGPIIPSKTIWKKPGKLRIDIENPAPGKRAGQIHLQDQQNTKYIYDKASDRFFTYDPKTKTRSFDVPKAVNEMLKKPDVRKAIDKGLKMLGEGN